MDLLVDLEARGLLQDSTDRIALGKRLADDPIGVYVGFDPTADSLHVGHLVGQITLRRFQLAGHRPVPLAGGATGMVGDPSGKSEERNLLDADTLRHNVERIKGQLSRLLDFEPGPFQARLVNNADWTVNVGVLDFLRDVGKHVTVQQMVAKESVRNRLNSEQGLSFTEFSYMLLQGNDFRHLYEHEGVEMQMGGSDQWGNIVLGADLIRRATGGHGYALTWPLITKSDGTKFGKTESGAVWLDPARTTPYEFRQFWMQLADADAERYLPKYSLRPLDEIEALISDHRGAPERRLVQRALASELTAMVHGQAAFTAADDAASLLFGGDPAAASVEALMAVAAEAGEVTGDASLLGDPVALIVATGLETSNGAARRQMAQSGIRVNGHTLTPESRLDRSHLLHGRFLLVRRGKNYRVVIFSGD